MEGESEGEVVPAKEKTEKKIRWIVLAAISMIASVICYHWAGLQLNDSNRRVCHHWSDTHVFFWGGGRSLGVGRVCGPNGPRAVGAASAGGRWGSLCQGPPPQPLVGAAPTRAQIQPADAPNPHSHPTP